MFSQLNHVSQIVLASSDITNFYTYNEVDYGKRYRIVGLETIIPTLYKYYRENYTVLFLDQNGDPLPLYESQTDRDLWGSGIDPTTGTNPNVGNIGKYYTGRNGKTQRLNGTFWGSGSGIIRRTQSGR